MKEVTLDYNDSGVYYVFVTLVGKSEKDVKKHSTDLPLQIQSEEGITYQHTEYDYIEKMHYQTIS